MSENNQFIKSDIGAQAAWKGFSSQTLYIASRIVAVTDDNCFYPEDIEDLVIKNGDKVVEAVQIKNVSADLTVSHLSSTKSSLSGEGFFNRVCSLHAQYPEFNIVKVVYFTSLGDELNGISKGNISYCKSVKEKLVKNHKLTANDAEWIISSLVLVKVDISTLEQTIYSQVKEYVETMAAPEIAKSLLIQHVSELWLFSDDDAPLVLSKVAEEVGGHTGNVWTPIISLRREDAARLGFDNAAEWMALLRKQRNIFAEQMKIAPENLRWYAAFHNEGHHPHCHISNCSVQSTEPHESHVVLNRLLNALRLYGNSIFSIRY